MCEQTFKESSCATYKVCSSMKKVVFFFKWYFFSLSLSHFPPHLSTYTSKNDLLTHHILPKNLCLLQWYYYSSATSAATKIPSLPPINKRRRLVHIIRVIYDSIRNRKNYFEIPLSSNWCWFFILISCSWSYLFQIQRGIYFFPFPYPIIDNPWC